MANKDLNRTSRKAKLIGAGLDAWWYEENDGAHVVAHLGTGTYAHVKITWAALRSALARKDKPAPPSPPRKANR